jgi:hypothetical protein
MERGERFSEVETVEFRVAHRFDCSFDVNNFRKDIDLADSHTNLAILPSVFFFPVIQIQISGVTPTACIVGES